MGICRKFGQSAVSVAAAASLAAGDPGAECILDNLPSAVLLLDSQDRIRRVNAAAEQLFSASRNQLEGLPLARLLLADSPLLAALAGVRADGQSRSAFGLRLGLARNGGFEVDCHLVPLAEAPGSVLVMLHPCSLAARIDRDLARGGGRKAAALAALLAHEVKNPLAGIRGAAQLLEPQLAEEDRPLARLIREESDRICRLVEEMEIFADAPPLRRRRVNIHEVLDHVRRLAEAGVARHCRFVEAYDPSLPEIEADREQLTQVFLNLVTNAAEAMDTGTITLATLYQHGLRVTVPYRRERLELPITVEVRDTGPGVPPELADHLFEPFVSGKPRGRGLGLAIVARIVADHGGLVSHVPSERGAIFRVRLPLAPPIAGEQP
ncbi:Nitrogen regulation protein NR(II) [bacterium HR40]|nr:Nitrogen regulation protein NR(II) [bacterium HR40]